MRIQILDAAGRDLAAGYRFYERQASGLGDYFLDTLFSDIDSLQVYAGIHPQYFGYYRLLSKRFPFAVYYLISGDLIRVYAVLDCRQNPASIGDRLSR